MGKKKIFPDTGFRPDRYMRRLHVNRKYKDRLFCILFGQDRDALLQLYNALNGSAYTDPSRLTVITLDNIIYMKMVNDLAFMVVGTLNLYEHQSTYNPNMPLRFLLYIAEEYDRIIHGQDANLYGEKLVTLPTPQCVVFYNGDRETADEELLRLSDAFQNKDVQTDLELTVHLRNINLGHNQSLMDGCPKLREYACLIGRVKENLADGRTVKASVEEAVNYCLDRGILTDFLTENRSGVLGMLRLLTEYDEKKHIRLLKRDAREEGLAEGMAEGLAAGMLQERAAMILELLSRYGEVPSELQTAIADQKDLPTLREWSRIAAECGSINAFMEQTGSGISRQ